MATQGYFKHLDIDQLKIYAKEWVKHFSYIKFEQIELRRYSPPLKYAKYAGPIDTIYAVVFKTLAPEEDLSNLPEEYHHMQTTEEISSRSYEKFVAETKYRETIWPKRYESLLGRDFKNVYYRGSFPGDNYLNEWTFIPLSKVEKLPLGVDNDTPPVVLYPNNVQSPLTEKTSAKPYDEKDAEGFVRSLVFAYENDNEISIKKPKIAAKCYTADSLGFSNCSKNKAWKNLVGVLKEPGHTYYVGPARVGEIRKKEYDSKQKLLGEVCKKIKLFIEREFSIELPEGFKLFELDRREKPGTYKFKFKIKNGENCGDSLFDRMSEDNLLKEIEKVNKNIRKHKGKKPMDENNALQDKLQKLCLYALEVRDIPSKTIERLINCE